MPKLGFDKELRYFTHDGAPIALSPKDLAIMDSLPWWQRIPFGPARISPGRVDCTGKLSKYLLDKLKFENQSVLGIGCYEGFPLYFVEAMGASRVVGIADDFGLTPTVDAAREFSHRILQSNVEFVNQSVYDLSPRVLGTFDVVLIFDALHHLRHPLMALERLADLSRAALIIGSPFVLSDDPTPWCALLPQFSGPQVEHNLSAMNRAWFFGALKRIGFTPLQSTVHEFDYLTTVAARTESPAGAPLLPESGLPTDEGMEHKTAILVMSCERYRQVWEPFFVLFRKFFPHCPYKVYFCSDRGRVEYPGIINIELGTDYQWAGNARRAIAAIDAEQVLVFQEDFLLNMEVNLPLLRKIVRHGLDSNAASIRLAPLPGPTGSWPGTPLLGTVGPFDDFRYSFQLTLWNKEVLSSLLSDGDDPWTTEFVAARRSTFCQQPFLSVLPHNPWPIPYLAYAVDQGEWSDSALELLRQHEISMTGITKRIARLERR